MTMLLNTPRQPKPSWECVDPNCRLKPRNNVGLFCICTPCLKRVLVVPVPVPVTVLEPEPEQDESGGEESVADADGSLSEQVSIPVLEEVEEQVVHNEVNVLPDPKPEPEPEHFLQEELREESVITSSNDESPCDQQESLPVQDRVLDEVAGNDDESPSEQESSFPLPDEVPQEQMQAEVIPVNIETHTQHVVIRKRCYYWPRCEKSPAVCLGYRPMKCKYVQPVNDEANRLFLEEKKVAGRKRIAELVANKRLADKRARKLACEKQVRVDS
jgi:hypothetical protein